mgnify:CR=1 FL=1
MRRGALLRLHGAALAKTLTIKTLAEIIHADFQRIQFTPDLLPADLIGTLIYNPREATFAARKGPIFANIVLADEINRASPKTQAALLEVMEERQVTYDGVSRPVPSPGACSAPSASRMRRSRSFRGGSTSWIAMRIRKAK